MADLWSYSTGEWGVNRVRVYERYEGSPLHIEWTGAKGRSLKNVTGKSVRDKDLAKTVANRLSQRLERESNTTLRRALGIQERRTLGELMERYHDDKQPTWGKSHTKDQRKMRRYWTQRLGADTDLKGITEATVERVVSEDTKRRDWMPRTAAGYLRYITTLFNYARRKLKWIGEHDALTAVDMPKAQPGGPSYTHEQMMALLEHAPEHSDLLDVALNVAYDTQARSKALLHLQPSDYLGEGRLRFRAEYDKANRERIAVLSPTTRWKLEKRLRTLGDSKWLFPGQGKNPLSYDRLRNYLHELEDMAGVPRVERRGWHSVKRRSVTDARNALGSMGAVSKQAGTTEKTLLRVYEQDDMGPKEKVAEAMEALRRKA